MTKIDAREHKPPPPPTLAEPRTNGNGTAAKSGGSKCSPPDPLPLVVALNCLEDCRLEEEALAGVALVQHVGLSQISDGRVDSAVAVFLHSLLCLPCAAQRRLRSWQLLLCLGAVDKVAETALAADLGLRLLHVDAGRAEENADTAIALLLGLLRHTHALAKRGFSGPGWLGPPQQWCRGMRRCKGLVLGIVGRSSASAPALAARALAFRMKVICCDVDEEKDGLVHGRTTFPSAVRKVESLKELLSQSDVVSLHCLPSTETKHLINVEALQCIKPGALIINTSSSRLLDDCALKQALLDGTISGCALDGVEGPQWLEAWVREMPNVLILPRSADYSEEVWVEIRAKAVSILRTFLLDGVVPSSAVSDEDDDDYAWQEERQEKHEKESIWTSDNTEQLVGNSQPGQELRNKQMLFQTPDPRIQDGGAISQSFGQRDSRSHGKGSGSGKKGKKRMGRRKSLSQNVDTLNAQQERETSWATNASGRDQVLSSSSRFASPEDSNKANNKREGGESTTSEKQRPESGLQKGSSTHAIEQLKEGLVIALRALDGSGYHVARQRGPGRGWCLDTMSNVTTRDPASQFLVVVRNKERVGLRSLAAGGKLLQANKKLELVFVNHTFDAWESWILEGVSLEECRLTNSKFRTVSLHVSIEVLAALGEDDGIARWLS